MTARAPARLPAAAEVVSDDPTEVVMDALASIAFLVAAVGMVVSVAMLVVAGLGMLLTRR